MPSAFESFHNALTSYARQDIAGALAKTKRAAELEPKNAVYREAVVYLERVLREGKKNVYISPEAFGAFIRGGGNVPLYENTSAALKRVYEEYDSLSLLDIGVGDGLALLPALTPNIRHLDVLEPSLAMLNQTTAALNERHIDHRAINATVQQLMHSGGGKWDIAQSTYAMQSLKPEERPNVLAWLRRHADRVLIVEFDAPDFQLPNEMPYEESLLIADRAHYFVSHYMNGLAEYADDGGKVAQGFLMPVFFGGFDPTEARVNFELPIANWAMALREAGFDEVRIEPIYDYWWAPAFLVDAK